MNQVSSKTLQLIGTGEGVKKEELSGLIYRSLGVQVKLNKRLTKDYLKDHITEQQMFYHPLWVGKLLVIADRKPFPPRKKPNMVFIDAVSGYRGLFPSVPPLKGAEASAAQTVGAEITKQEAEEKYIIDIQEKQINRSYVLKKPRYELRELFLTYLPLWKIRVDSSYLTKEFVINGNTGESEEFMSKLWKSREWRL
ncbi:hypothetical protein [Halobacillus massiliensis]|uniref:hypothetical protein n=1 Tax=Halobacillus massiliensis TaxID=1926286 RepID=UPI00117BA228|nr:hypothetical protein [Halobacillus massiliensis]